MKLKRTLPSRMTGAPLPESSPAEKPVQTAEVASGNQQQVQQQAQPQPSPAQAAPQTQSGQSASAALAAAASDAFGLMPVGGEAKAEASAPAPRVLEESFVVPVISAAPAVPAVSVPEVTASVSSPVSVAAISADAASVQAVGQNQTSPAPVAEAVEAPRKDVQTQAAAQPVPQAEAKVEAKADTGPEVKIEGWGVSAPEVKTPAAPAAVQPAQGGSAEVEAKAEVGAEEIKAEPAKAAVVETAQPAPVALPGVPEAVKAPEIKEAAEVAAPQPKAESAAPVAEEALPQGPTDFLAPGAEGASFGEPSRPDDNPFKRRVGRKGGRDEREDFRKGGQQKQSAQQQSQQPPRQPAQQPENRAAAKNEGAAEPAAPAVQQPVVQQAAQAEVAVAAPAVTPAPRVGRGRMRTARDFAAATIAPAEKPEKTELTQPSGFAANVPVDTRPLSRVDEELIAAGIVQGPEADDLTQNVPGALAVAEMESGLPEEMEPAPSPVQAQVQAQAAAPLPPVRQQVPGPKPAMSERGPAQNAGRPAVSAPADDPVFPKAAELPHPAFSSVPPRQQAPAEDDNWLQPGKPLAGKGGGSYTSAALARAGNEVVEDALPETRSDLPWVAQASSGGAGAWDVDVPTFGAGSAAAKPEKPVDFYKPAMPQQAPAAGGAPWAAPGAGMPPPEIMGQYKAPKGGSGFPVWGMGLGLVAVAVLGFMVWSNNKQGGPQDKLASWTGGLTLQGAGNKPDGQQAGAGQTVSGSSFSMADISSNKGALMPPADQTSSTARIDFKDVTPGQENGPIVAEGSETMPEDVGMIAKWQQAVAQARAEKKTGVAPAAPETAAAQTPAESLTPESLKQELDNYRRTLAESGTAAEQQTAAKNNASVVRDPDGYMDGKQMAGNDGQVLLPPPSNSGAKGGSSNVLPPPELYTNNPKNLPIVGEPTANAAPRVRTLADFEADPFEPEREKVRIPRGLKPKMAATDFPSLEVLSFVPQKGIIAYADGRQGVLLVGESISGWELTNVTNDVAEFRAGRKSHYVTAEN